MFLTGDVGFNAIELLQKAIGPRVINCGVAEANIVSMAAGMASKGLKPIVYSIAPFVTHRVAEQLKIDICLANANVKIVGNGGGYGYGIMGATHHAIEDIALMSSLQNMTCYIPYNNKDAIEVTEHMIEFDGPSYLRLGYSDIDCYSRYLSIRHLDVGDKVTVIGMGPVVLNALNLNCDVFAISELPVKGLYADIFRSIMKTKKLIIVEEHVARGGLAEYIILEFAKCCHTVKYETYHLCAHGYPNNLYGSQAYHQKINGLDRKSIEEVVNGI